MTQLRISQAAKFLGVSHDTVRRLVEAGTLPGSTDEAGRSTVDAYTLATYAQQQAAGVPDLDGVASSARNRFVGIVTDVRTDAVMAQVELQCGPFRVVSLMSTEAVNDLGLTPGSVAVAVIKSTNVIVETKPAS